MYGSLLWLAVYADVNSVSLQSDSKASFSVETTEKAEHQSADCSGDEANTKMDKSR